MRDRLDTFLRDVTLTTLALGIAIGWALFQVGRGLADTVTTLLRDFDSSEIHYFNDQPLAWQVGGHVLAVESLVAGLIELAVVVAVALFVQSRRTADR